MTRLLATSILTVVIVGCDLVSPTPTTDIPAIQTQAVKDFVATMLAQAEEEGLTSAAGPTLTPTSGPITYVIQPGDTLSSIAAEYGTTADAICLLNFLPDCRLIYPGEELLVPSEGLTPTAPTPLPTATHAPTGTVISTPTPTPIVSSAPTPTPSLIVETAQVVEIVDGDTIDVQIGGRVFRVRYIGINTPEVGQPCADEVTAKNVELVGGKTVTLVKDISETDKFDRLLRYVYVGDLFVNAELVRQGYANAATYPPDVAHADLFVQLEAEARAAGRGCWAAD